MLKQRVITAVILLVVLLAALLAPSPWPFPIVTMIAIGAAGWEWCRLNDGGARGSIAFGLALVLACGMALAIGWDDEAPSWLWWMAALIWVPGGTWVLRLGPDFWPHVPKFVRRMVGALALWTAWLALVNARAAGLGFLLSVLSLVWVADIAAYFGGRAFGRRKLAPSISPGKSWAGFWSGMLGVFVLALAWLFVEQRTTGGGSTSLYAQLSAHVGLAGLAVALAFLSSMSVVGDLVESLVKRSVGAKDSSTLLPGHGGVLDRIDALLPVVPLAMALASLA